MTLSNTTTSISQIEAPAPALLLTLPPSANASSTRPVAEPSPTASPEPAQSAPLTEVEFTLRTEIADGRMLYVGAGGDIEGIVSPDLLVSPGTTVRVILVNDDGISHDLFFPDFGAQSATIGRKGETTEVTFTAPSDYPAGAYVYYCTRPGHRESGQEGWLIVKQAE